MLLEMKTAKENIFAELRSKVLILSGNNKTIFLSHRDILFCLLTCNITNFRVVLKVLTDYLKFLASFRNPVRVPYYTQL